MIENLAALRARLDPGSPSENYRFDSSDPRRLNHLSLEQQKKRAKELLCQWRQDPQQDVRERKLSDAQRVVASSQGFSSWPQLKAHIERTRMAREALTQGLPEALDAECSSLHIRCGTDIRQAPAHAANPLMPREW